LNRTAQMNKHLPAALEIDLKVEQDVDTLRSFVHQLCLDNSYPQHESSEFVIAVSEIAQNCIFHGRGGGALVYLSNSARVIRVHISDTGSGIGSLNLAYQDGYSTMKGSLGLGLDAARRLSDKFSIESNASGTTVQLEKYLPFTIDQIEYCVVSIPDQRYQYNGDTYFIKEFDGDKVLFGVIDGMGQGYNAFVVATMLKKLLQENCYLPLDELLSLCNSRLIESEFERGAVVFLGLVHQLKLSYISVGDVHAYVFDAKKGLTKLRSVDGILGYMDKVPKGIPSISLQENSRIFSCTDGLSEVSEITVSEVQQSVQNLSKTLFNKYCRQHGDATILSVQLKNWK